MAGMIAPMRGCAAVAVRAPQPRARWRAHGRRLVSGGGIGRASPTTGMTTLVEKLTAPAVRPQVVSACCDLIDREVDGKSGLSGFAVKTGYKVVKAIKPGFVTQVVEALLPDFAAAMEPMQSKAGGGGEPFAKYLDGHRDEVADALLSVTDAKAQRSSNGTVRKTYEKLRGGAREHVIAAVPNLVSTLRPYL